MIASAARAGSTALLSAAILLGPGCGEENPARSDNASDPVRRAAFRAVAARDFMVNCPGGSARAESATQIRRLEELKQLAIRKQAGRSIWLGENDWAAVARHSDREGCGPGEEAYREALADFMGRLDELAGRIAAFET